MSSCRTWLGTENNPDEPENTQQWLRRLHEATGARYVCGQLERGENGTLHVQFYINFSGKKRLAAMKKISPRTHWEAIKVDNGADKYCMKEDTRVEGPWEFGERPIRRAAKTDWQFVWDKAVEGDLTAIDPKIRVQHYRNL